MACNSCRYFHAGIIVRRTTEARIGCPDPQVEEKEERAPIGECRIRSSKMYGQTTYDFNGVVMRYRGYPFVFSADDGCGEYVHAD